MDPESSLPPLCKYFASCLRAGGDLSKFTLEPPPPADPLLPSVLLFLGCVALAMSPTIDRRFGDDTHRLIAGGLLIAAIVVAGIRMSQSVLYEVREELGMAIDLVVTYGVPAGIAAIAGLVVGGLADDRLTRRHRNARAEALHPPEERSSG